MTTVAQPACLRRDPVHRPCLQARVSRALVATWVSRMPVRVVLPDGSHLGGGSSVPANAPTIEILRPTALFERLAHDAAVGFGDGYLAGDWRTAPGTDLADAMTACLRGLLLPGRRRLAWLRSRLDRPSPIAEAEWAPRSACRPSTT